MPCALAASRAKRIEVCNSGDACNAYTCIWGSADLVVFKIIWGHTPITWYQGTFVQIKFTCVLAAVVKQGAEVHGPLVVPPVVGRVLHGAALSAIKHSNMLWEGSYGKEVRKVLSCFAYIDPVLNFLLCQTIVGGGTTCSPPPPHMCDPVLSFLLFQTTMVGGTIRVCVSGGGGEYIYFAVQTCFLKYFKSLYTSKLTLMSTFSTCSFWLVIAMYM